MSDYAPITVFPNPLVKRLRTVFSQNRSQTDYARLRRTETRWSSDYATDYADYAASDYETHHLFRGGVSVARRLRSRHLFNHQPREEPTGS
jgi:hypothetical protein